MNTYGLNDEQLRAINTSGPLFLNASAGSGKTKTLISKILSLIDSGVSPKNILSVTFTNKAAKEMRDRLARSVDVKEMQVSTIHSLCVQIIRKFIKYTHLKYPFTIYDDKDQQSIIKTIIKARDLPGDPFEYLSEISKSKSENKKPENDVYLIVYNKYQEILKQNNACDFDDLLIFAHDCLKHEDCREYYTNLWKNILVDECHGYKTHIMVDYNRSIPIGDAYYDDSITHILSYNLESKLIEKKKILKKIEKPYYGHKCDLWIENSKKERVYLKPTENHEYYVVGKGYIRADSLIPGDTLIEYNGEFISQYASWCKYPECGEKVYADVGKQAHLHSHYKKEHGHKLKTHVCEICGEEIKNKVWHNFWKHGDKEKQKEIRSKGAESHKKFFMTEKGLLDRKNLSKRMILNNPDHIPEYKDKAAKSWKKNFYSKSPEERKIIIERFQNAPIHKNKPNNCEKAVINLNITNLKFTGDGKYYVTLKIDGKKRSKNPDFIYVPEKCGLCKIFESCKMRNISKTSDKCSSWELVPSYRTNKVVEIMDFEYWHTIEEANNVEKAYDEMGLKCLILDAKMPLNEKRAKIEAFINNHYATVISSKVIKKKDHKNNLVYTFKIEDNHNYFVLASKFKAQFKLKDIPVTPILVSNCQDTSKIQYDIITLLYNKEKNNTMFLTGDLNQSIYSWRGARPENISDFIKEYNATQLSLTYNYRSCSEIISHANSFLQYGEPMIPKTARTGKVSLTEFASFETEAEQIAQALLNMGNYNGTAIIYRVNTRSVFFEQMFSKYRIPYKVVSELPFYQRKVSKDLLAALKASNNPDDRESLSRIINNPKRGFGDAKREQLLLRGRAYLEEVAEEMPRIKTFMKLLDDIKGKTPARALTEYLDRSGYRGNLEKDSDKFMVSALENMMPNFDTVEELVLASTFLERDSGEGVNLITAHGSKGLEFDRVFVVGVEEGLWPHKNSTDNEEEERLFYVAVTRAQRWLNISYSRSRSYKGNLLVNSPSYLFKNSYEHLHGKRLP